MAAILGLGMTHVPLLAGRDQDMSRILRRALQDPDLPARYRTPEGWPEGMRREWSDDEGLAAARHHREALL
ncbi:MAG TPA: extradiol ring-cleavage dioxygenase, partial [Methylomirabilota bacterium]|nr:extradiol ring-cleavage dioxygenase [Methylomirabilota bacterium]